MSGKSSISKSLVWVLMGLLILGLGGFGVTNLSGTIRSVGSVGETDIDVNEYARALQADIRAAEAERGEALSFVQAQEMQIDKIVLSRLVAAASLEEETRRLGVSIGDANLRQQIIDIPSFRGLNGEFDREAYSYTLEQSGQTEAAFEENIRAEASRTLLQAAVVAGVGTPDSYTQSLMSYVGEQRKITWAMLDRAALVTGLPVPDESDLIAYHQTHLPDFTTPEVKQITYAWLTPEMIIDTVEVAEDALRAAYEQRVDEFNLPERRLVERLVYPDATAASAALARITSGDASFEDEVAKRGLALADVDLGDVGLSDLDAAGTAVFNAVIGDVTGPLDTSLGPALFRVNAVLQAQETSFEDAQPQLRDELAGDRARRVIDAQIDTIDDLLAGGATLEDLAKETDMELGTIDWHPGMTDDIGAYAAFRTAAETVTQSDYPDIGKLEDDGIFAIRLNKIVEPEILPLDQVRTQAEQGWQADATASALREQVAPQLEQLKTGTTFADLDMEPTTTLDVTRSSFPPGAPPEFIDTVFGMTEGDIEILEGDARIFVLRLDSMLPPDSQNEEMVRLRQALSQDASAGLSQDLYQVLADDIRARAGIELNQNALNAVHANFQ